MIMWNSTPGSFIAVPFSDAQRVLWARDFTKEQDTAHLAHDVPVSGESFHVVSQLQFHFLFAVQWINIVFTVTMYFML